MYKKNDFKNILIVSWMIITLSSCKTNCSISSPKNMIGEKLLSLAKTQSLSIAKNSKQKVNLNLKHNFSVYITKYRNQKNYKCTPFIINNHKPANLKIYSIYRRKYSNNKQGYYKRTFSNKEIMAIAFVSAILACKFKELPNSPSALPILYKNHFACPYNKCGFINAFNEDVVGIQKCTVCCKCKNLVLVQSKEIQAARTVAQLAANFAPFGGFYNLFDGFAQGKFFRSFRGAFKIGMDVFTCGAASPVQAFYTATFLGDICDNLYNKEYFEALLGGILLGLDLKMNLNCYNANNTVKNLAKGTGKVGKNASVNGFTSLKKAREFYINTLKRSSKIKLATRNVRVTSKQIIKFFNNLSFEEKKQTKKFIESIYKLYSYNGTLTYEDLKYILENIEINFVASRRDF